MKTVNFGSPFDALEEIVIRQTCSNTLTLATETKRANAKAKREKRKALEANYAKMQALLCCIAIEATNDIASIRSSAKRHYAEFFRITYGFEIDYTPYITKGERTK